jgi:sec-independent protein translocase protein TatB
MFDIFSWQHIIILLVIALVVVGPKDLPRLMKMAGKWAGKARAMANEFRASFDEMARQTELEELRAEINAIKKINPLSDVQNSMADINNAVSQPAAAMSGAPAQAPDDVSSFGQSNPEPRTGELSVTGPPPDQHPPSVPTA